MERLREDLEIKSGFLSKASKMGMVGGRAIERIARAIGEKGEGKTRLTSMAGSCRRK